MKTVTSVFDRTPLGQRTYRLLSTEESDADCVPYEPDAIRNWNHGFYEPTALRSLDMILHEVCHVIDLAHRNRFRKLLLPNYGYSGLEGDVITPTMVRNEVFVLSLQHLISKDILGDSNRSYASPRVHERFKVSDDDWMCQHRQLLRQHKARGLGYYYGLWKDACRYVRENRGC